MRSGFWVLFICGWIPCLAIAAPAAAPILPPMEPAAGTPACPAGPRGVAYIAVLELSPQSREQHFRGRTYSVSRISPGLSIVEEATARLRTDASSDAPVAGGGVFVAGPSGVLSQTTRSGSMLSLELTVVDDRVRVRICPGMESTSVPRSISAELGTSDLLLTPLLLDGRSYALALRPDVLVLSDTTSANRFRRNQSSLIAELVSRSSGSSIEWAALPDSAVAFDCP